MRYVELDFETASACDLKLAGAWRYAEDITTEVLCVAYTGGVWFPSDDLEPLRTLAADPGVTFVAHNAQFEQAIWLNIMVAGYGLPPVPVDRWEDTLASCAYRALPLALDKAARALRLNVEKDMDGNRLTLSMSKPLTKAAHAEGYPGPTWGTKAAWSATFQPGMLPERTPARMQRIGAYCAQDVAVEAAVGRRLGLLSNTSSHERKIWCIDQTINQRGVRLDMDFVRAAELVVERASVKLKREFVALTGGVAPGQVAKVIEWCGAQGVALDNLQKGPIAELLGADEPDDFDSNAGDDDGDGDLLGSCLPLPVRVRRVLAIRQMLGSASVKKLARMRACVCDDGRARGLLQYHAASTGRWGGRLIQPQNFPRGALKVKPEAAVAAIMTGDPDHVEEALGLPAIECVASSLRHALIPDPGKVFLVGDFAGIEARIVLALAGQHDKTAMMAAGQNVYLDVAHLIYNAPPGTLTKKDIVEYTIGKNTVLGCGFQMGDHKFHSRYCPKQTREFAHGVISTYREDWAPMVPPLWYALGDAALDAARGGRPDPTYGVTYRLHDGWLVAKLPSGWQRLWYPSPALARDEKFNRPCWTYRAEKMGHSVSVKAYGGLLTENVVQGLARGLLCASISRIAHADIPIVLTVHDEIIAEVDEAGADVKAFEQLMAEPTLWAREIKIPIAVEAWAGDRYRK